MLSIIVLSSDGYSDCWDPFFSLLKKNFPEAKNYEIILSTNTKEFEFSGLNIKTLRNGIDTPWSKRLKLSLASSSNEIVMVLVEDFFILSRINSKVFENLLNSIKTNKEIDHIRMLYKMDRVKTVPSKYQYLDEIDQYTKHRFLFLPGFWKKSVLQKYVTNFESPYMAEKMGVVKSWILKDGFYAISKSYIEKFENLYNCGTSGAIVKGKWEKWLPNILEENNVYIDFKIRGFRDDKSKQKANIKIYMNLLNNPFSTFKSVLSVLALFFKSIFK